LVFFGVWCLVFGVFTASAVDGPLTPEESLKYLKTEPGLRVELVASEPMVVDPVAVAWDERGRMFVVENRGFPSGRAKASLRSPGRVGSKTRTATANTTSAPCSPTVSRSKRRHAVEGRRGM